MTSSPGSSVPPSQDTPSVPSPPSTAPRVAVITGAGGGLGRVFAQALAADGWLIVALGRTQSTLEETLAACEASPGAGDAQHLALTCDVTDAEQVDATFDRVLSSLGRVDLLINNAGITGPTGRLDSLDPDAVRATFETNVMGAWLCARAAFRAMERGGGGRIINNGSIAAHAPRAGAAAYAASKAAVASLTTSLSLEGRGLNITATELDIGNARTALLEQFTQPSDIGAEPTFDAVHAGAVIASLANLPLSVTVDQVTLTATGMPYMGRG